MNALAQVTAVEPLGGRLLRVSFSDDLVRELDFAGALPGIFALIDDDATFAAAQVDALAGTVCWPNGLVLDPDVLHGDQPAAASIGVGGAVGIESVGALGAALGGTSIRTASPGHRVDLCAC